MTDRPRGGPGHWLSPSSAARLLNCPASVAALSTGTPIKPTSEITNAGSLAHLAVQRWVEAGDWRAPDSTARLMSHFTSGMDDHHLDIGAIQDGRLTAARLETRAPALAHALHRLAPHGEVRSEALLQDPEIHLWGIADIIAGSQSLAIVDIKTGVHPTGSPLSCRIHHQLLLYAALVHAETSRWPATLAVFSLRQGYQDLEYLPEDAEFLVSRATTARDRWAEGHRDARPTEDGCRFCPRRLECDPHWEAARQWRDESAAEGLVLQTRRAENGQTAVELTTAEGPLWISNLVLPVDKLIVGKHLRAIFLTPARPASTDHQKASRASNKTQVRVR